MLELPELETICGGLSCLIGKHIKYAEVDPLATNVNSFEKNVVDKRLYYLFRSGRFIILGLRKKSATSFLVLQPTLLSKIVIYISGYNPDNDAIHRIALLKLNNFFVSITDEGRETKLSYFSDHKSLRKFLQDHGYKGKDPIKLTKVESFMRLVDRFKSPSLTVEELFLDPHIIQGVGPYLVSEILFKSNIHPSSITYKLTEQHWQTVYESMCSIIQESMKNRGNSIYGYVDAFGNMGLYQSSLMAFANPDASITEMGTYYFTKQELII